MIDTLIPLLEEAARLGLTWGPLLVLLFMAIESSFIPFPSEVVMIPAGFLAARGEFFPGGNPWAAAGVGVACGIAGSLAGAYVNYFLALKLGRPFLHRHGRWLFLPPHRLDRAEELFRRYGDLTTFLCRLVPVIRQLISLPAGVARMDFKRFTVFTAAGAGLWVAVLAGVGFWLGRGTAGMAWREVVVRGQELAAGNLPWVLLGAAALAGAWWGLHRLAVGRGGKRPAAPPAEEADPCAR